jgi:hypothetical protein
MKTHVLKENGIKKFKKLKNYLNLVVEGKIGRGGGGGAWG